MVLSGKQKKGHKTIYVLDWLKEPPSILMTALHSIGII